MPRYRLIVTRIEQGQRIDVTEEYPSDPALLNGLIRLQRQSWLHVDPPLWERGTDGGMICRVTVHVRWWHPAFWWQVWRRSR